MTADTAGAAQFVVILGVVVSGVVIIAWAVEQQ